MSFSNGLPVGCTDERGCNCVACTLCPDCNENGPDCRCTGRVDCDVSPEYAAQFVVTMKTGRTFHGCGIHGSGGALHGRESFVRAQRIRSRGGLIRLITRDRADGSTYLDVRSIDVVEFAVVRS
jgi:hypothetical protein